MHIKSLQHRARVAVALARAAPVDSARRRRFLRRAERDARRMAAENTLWSNALVVLLRGGIAAVRGARDESVTLLETAERLLMAADMVLYGMAARHRRGRLLGGEYGRELWSSAEDWMRSHEILNPERMSATLAPGFEPQNT